MAVRKNCHLPFHTYIHSYIIEWTHNSLHLHQPLSSFTAHLRARVLWCHVLLVVLSGKYCWKEMCSISLTLIPHLSNSNVTPLNGPLATAEWTQKCHLLGVLIRSSYSSSHLVPWVLIHELGRCFRIPHPAFSNLLSSILFLSTNISRDFVCVM